MLSLSKFTKKFGYRAIAVGIKFNEWIRQNSNHQCGKILIRRSTAQHSATRDMFKLYELDFALLNKQFTENQLCVIDLKIFDFKVIVFNQEIGDQMFIGTERLKVI